MWVDPIADQFAWVSPFNYAENEPVGHIDLWGLQKTISVIQRGKGTDGWYNNGSWTMESTDGDKRWNNYAPSSNLGKGHLLVFHNLETGQLVNAYKPTVGERISAFFSKILPRGNSNSKTDGGIMYFKSDGKGGETRFSPNADIGPLIDKILNAFTAAKAVGDLPSKAPGTLVEEIADMLQFTNNATQTGAALQETFHGDRSTQTSTGEPVDSICNTCTDKPHGLPYRRIDEQGNPIDTIDPKQK